MPTTTSSPTKTKVERSPPPDIQRSSPDDSATNLIEEVIDTANCYGFECLYDALYATLVHYRWPPSIIFTVSVLLKRGNAQYWSQKLLPGGQQGLHPWAVRKLDDEAPRVSRALQILFTRWDTRFAAFKDLASTTFLGDNNHNFSSRCKPPRATSTNTGSSQGLEQKRPCPVYSTYNGDFDQFHLAILDKVFAFATEKPALMGNVNALKKFCAGHVKCHICALRVADSARASWLRIMTHNCWSLDTTHGAQGGWSAEKNKLKEQRKEKLNEKKRKSKM
jgi:hypothetical protein